MTDNLLGLLVVIPLATAVASVALIRHRIPQRVLGLVSFGSMLVLALGWLSEIRDGDVLVSQMGAWPAPFGITLVFDSLSGLSVLTQPVTLTRSGSVFKGRLSVVDGEPLTSWADYRHFELEIDDPNDIDMDGLPDIVSLPEPAAAAQALASLLTLLCLNRRRRSRSTTWSSPAMPSSR